MSYLFGKWSGERIDLRDASGTTRSGPLQRSDRLIIARSDCVVLSLSTERSRRAPVHAFLESSLPVSYPGDLSRVDYDYFRQHSSVGASLLVVLMDRDLVAKYRTAAGRGGLTVLADVLRTCYFAAGPAHRRIRIDLGFESQLLTMRHGTVASSTLTEAAASCDHPLECEPNGPFRQSDGDDPRVPTEILTLPDLARLLATTAPSRTLFALRRRPLQSRITAALLCAAVGITTTANLSVYRQIPSRLAGLAEQRRIAAHMGEQSATERLRRELDSLTAEKPTNVYSLLSDIAAAVEGAARLRELSLSDRELHLTFESASPFALLPRLSSLPLVGELELVETGPLDSQKSRVVLRGRLR